MGSFCPNLFSKSFKSYYPSPQAFPNLVNFNTENDNYFYIPHKYTSITTKLSNIINSNSDFWQEEKLYLHESKKYLLETLTTLDNFIFQEDNLFESSFPKEKKGINSLESPNYIQMTVLRESTIESECKKTQGTTLTTYDYNEKFRLKKFLLEINRLIFLGENDPKDQNMISPYIEIEFMNRGGQSFLEKSEKISLKIRTKTNNEALNPIWNEVFDIDLMDLLKISSFENIQFSISLYYHEKLNSSPKLMGEKYLFSFTELMNQMLFEKVINIRSKNERTGGCFAIFLFRCQLIHDYFKLLNHWKNEIEVKLEIISRIIQKISLEENGQKFKRIAINNYRLDNTNIMHENIFNKTEDKKKSMRNFSLMSGENSEINLSSIYDNQYFIK